MLIAGAKGHGKEVLDVLLKNLYQLEDIFFFDDHSESKELTIYNCFPIIRSIRDVNIHFAKVDPNFILGVGNPVIRSELSKKLIRAGGILNSIISKFSLIGTFNVELGNGLNIMHNSIIGNNVTISEGVLINQFASVHHDVRIGKFSEIAPHSVLLGGASIGDYTFIGSNATILPNIKIGSNVIVGAGAVVANNLPDNCTAVGVPAKVIKRN